MKKIESFCLAAAVFLLISTVGVGTIISNTATNAAQRDDLSGPLLVAASTSPSLGLSNVTPASSEQFALTAIDVGRGDALLLSWPDRSGGSNYTLVDGGTTDDWPFVNVYLSSHGIQHLDAIVCTHEHDDHMNGLIELLKSNITVSKAYDPGFLVCTNGCPELAKVKEYLKLLEERNVTRKIVKAGDKLDSGNPSVVVRILNPDPTRLIVNASLSETQNANSIALEATYNGARFLLMGDTQLTSIRQMMSEGYIKQADVLKIGHHGFISDNNEFKEFIATVQPKFAILTCGCYRSAEKVAWQCQISPIPASLSASTVYRSACSGDISIATPGNASSDGIQYTVTTTKSLSSADCVAECNSTCKA